MRKQPNSLRSTAARLTEQMGWNVTQKMVRDWKDKGYPLDDPQALEKRLRNQERLPKGMPSKKLATQTPQNKPAQSEGLSESAVEAQLRDMYERLLAVTDYEEARTLRTQMQGIKDILKELREQNRYILKETAQAAGAQAAVSVRGELEKLEDALPPILDGLTALQMKNKLREYARSIMLDLSRYFEL